MKMTYTTSDNEDIETPVQDIVSWLWGNDLIGQL